ncbi:hypothetical protein LZ667_02720 [Hafnia alvei]|uniref:hypothetical protein n=1 Tax=Hafnia alvei TaxID=569 RepID=UPI001F435612|nr:hypothetical protein [Hafnia alvei]MCE9870305.1 hypothetical protein [Hafnia alvei]
MTHISEIPAGTLVKQAHAGVKLIADQYPEAAAILREAITRFDVLREVHQLAKQEAQPVIPRWPSDEVERDALRYRFLRDKDFFGDEDEQGLVGWEGLVELSYNEFDAAVDARISHPNIDYVKLDTALRKHIPAQPVSEPYKLPELNDELIEILGRPNFTCTKLAECLRHCGQDIKRKSENEQAAVLHVLLNLYIKHGNDWRKHAEEAFTPAPAQEGE